MSSSIEKYREEPATGIIHPPPPGRKDKKGLQPQPRLTLFAIGQGQWREDLSHATENAALTTKLPGIIVP
jgi:hypothetical protein